MKHEKDWYKDLVIYQIYPRSFKDGNHDGIGDLKGMIEKLDYLQELGINAVWMSPVFASPNVDNGYDISDYTSIMEEFGTMEDWDAFRDGAHARGIAIIMDLVLNHSSDRHIWFQESRKSRNNPYSDYYIWRDPAPDGGAPNGWMSVFGGSAWEYVAERGQYYLHFFAKEQPDLNWDNPETKEKIFDIIRFWNDKGVDGYRIDAISYLDKGLDGRANPNEQFGTVACVNLEGTHRYIREMVAKTMTPDHLMSVGEVNINNDQDAIHYSSAASEEFNMAIPFVPPIVEIQTWSPEKMKRVSAYRRALDAFLADPYNDSFELPDDVIEELNRTSHRHYSPGFYFGKEQAQQTPSHTYVRDWDFIGTVDSWENGVAHCTQRGKFAVGDSIEILQPDGSVVKLTPAWIENADGERVDATPHPMMQYTIPCETPLMAYSLIRMQKQ